MTHSSKHIAAITSSAFFNVDIDNSALKSRLLGYTEI